MEFKKGTVGYFKLGIVFMIFGLIPTAIIGMVGGPLLLGGIIFGGLSGFGIAIIGVIVVAILAQGWFVYWFYDRNKFRSRR